MLTFVDVFLSLSAALRSWDRTFQQLSRAESGFSLNAASSPSLFLSFPHMPPLHLRTAVRAETVGAALWEGVGAASGSRVWAAAFRTLVSGWSVHRVVCVFTARRSLSSRLP